MQLLGLGAVCGCPLGMWQGTGGQFRHQEPLRWPSAHFTSAWRLPEEEAQRRSVFQIPRASKGDCEGGAGGRVPHEAGALTGASGA